MGLHYSVHQSLFFGLFSFLLKSSTYISFSDVILHTCFSFQGGSGLCQIINGHLIAEILLGLPFLVSVSRRDLKVIFVLILVQFEFNLLKFCA